MEWIWDMDGYGSSGFRAGGGRLCSKDEAARTLEEGMGHTSTHTPNHAATARSQAATGKTQRKGKPQEHISHRRTDAMVVGSHARDLLFSGGTKQLWCENAARRG